MAISAANAYLARLSSNFDFCLPTKATIAPDTPDWLHEIKYNGHRFRLERDGDRPYTCSFRIDSGADVENPNPARK